MTPQEFQSKYNDFSPKRQAVLQAKLKGKTNKEIAQSLGINEGTVRKHLSETYQVLGLSNKDEDQRGGWEKLQALFFQLQPGMIATPAPVESDWVGRETDIEKLQKLVAANHKILLIVGEGGIGKTTFAKRLLGSYNWDRSPLTIKVPLQLEKGKYIQSAESEVQRWLQQEFDEEVPINFMQSLSLLEKKLRSQRVPIFIDNLETIIRKGIFLPGYRDYVELLRMISDRAILGFTLITSREKLKEPRLSEIKTYALPSLTLNDWQVFFAYPTGTKDQEALQLLHKSCNGNAQAMRILHSSIDNSYAGNINAFYNDSCHSYPITSLQEPSPFLINDQLRLLIEQQFNRISAHSGQAHQLLCRLAACRYQSIELLPDELVRRLLWDVAPSAHLELINHLCDSSLVQFYHGRYSMHPGVRAAALCRLKTSGEWEKTNRVIAHYWFNSVDQIQSSVQGLQTLEAYHHFLAIEDYDAAWGVLRRPVISIFPEELFLHLLSWRLFREVLELAQALEGRVSPDQEPSLYHCLGDCHIYMLEDGIDTATYWHQRAQQAARREGDVWTEFSSGKDLGLCYFVAGEYQLGLDIYRSKLNLALTSSHSYLQQRIGSCYCELSLFHSCLGETEMTITALDHAKAHLATPLQFVPPWQACWDLNMAGLAQKNIGHYTQAQQTLGKALEITTDFNFGPDRARAWYILGDVYRGLGDFEASIFYQEKAIKFFTKIGAKYELAESYNYLGLTYQELEDFEQAKSCYQEAIKIFTQIKTPIQINKTQGYVNSLNN